MTTTVCFDMTLDRDEGEIEVQITAKVTYHWGVYSGPMEDSYPDECEVEVLKVEPDVELTDGELEHADERAVELALDR